MLINPITVISQRAFLNLRKSNNAIGNVALIFREEFCTVHFSNIAQKPLAEIISIYGLGSLAMRQLKKY